jgi:hypothetical protein
MRILEPIPNGAGNFMTSEMGFYQTGKGAINAPSASVRIFCARLATALITAN